MSSPNLALFPVSPYLPHTSEAWPSPKLIKNWTEQTDKPRTHLTSLSDLNSCFQVFLVLVLFMRGQKIQETIFFDPNKEKVFESNKHYQIASLCIFIFLCYIVIKSHQHELDMKPVRGSSSLCEAALKSTCRQEATFPGHFKGVSLELGQRGCYVCITDVYKNKEPWKCYHEKKTQWLPQWLSVGKGTCCS